MNERPFYLDIDEGVFAVFHPSEGNGAAVLVCPPLGWDDLASYRPRRDWAVQLAAAGHPTLRFDLPGTGDSAGGPDDPHRVEAWIAAVGGAAGWLAGYGRVCALGVGLGGMLALHAAADGAPIVELVLWGAPARGRTLLRELRAFSRIETATIVGAGAPEPLPLPEGVLAPGGFTISAETNEALGTLGLPGGPAPQRVLLLERDGIAVDVDLRAHLEGTGADVTVAAGNGYGAMMDTPGISRASPAAVETVERWLERGAPGSHRSAQTPVELDAITLGGVRERPLLVEQPFGRLHGVLTEPLGAAGDLTAVLLNAGGVRRIGPNRMWVEFARRWAAEGVPTLRIDLEGLGDSDGGSDFTGDADFYGVAVASQVQAVFDALEREGRPPRFLLGGLCSGAYWSFQVALVDRRVVGTLLLNSRVLFWDEALEGQRGLRWLRRNFLRPAAWARVLRGQIRVDPGRMARSALRALARRRGSGELLAALDRLRERGVRLNLVFCDGEPLREELEALGPLDAWPNLTLDVVPGRDHMFRPLWMHPYVHAAADRALRSLRAPAD